MRGILAAAGAVSVATLSFATPQPYALAANVLTVSGYTFGGTISWDMDEIFQGRYCSWNSGNRCSTVDYNSGIAEGGEQDGLRALRRAINITASPTTVLGFSQGATISTHWIRENAGTSGAPDPDELSFVLVANPLRKYGGSRTRVNSSTATPDSEYSVLDIAIEYDGAADFPTGRLNMLALANALAGFRYVHIFGYDEIDLDTADKLVWTEGNTTYVLLRRENLPLLEPLRMMGLGELADQLNGPLKKIIDRSYNRNYDNLVDPEDHDEVLAQALAARPSSPVRAAAFAVTDDTVPASRLPRHAAGADPSEDHTQTTDRGVDTDLAIDPGPAEGTPDGDTDERTDADVDVDIDVDVESEIDADADADADADNESGEGDSTSPTESAVTSGAAVSGPDTESDAQGMPAATDGSRGSGGSGE